MVDKVFSSDSNKAARDLAGKAASGERLNFVEASVYDAMQHLPWAKVVASLLKPGRQLLILEGHPMLWAIHDAHTDALRIEYPYFKSPEPMEFNEDTTYVCRAAGFLEELHYDQDNAVEPRAGRDHAKLAGRGHDHHWLRRAHQHTLVWTFWSNGEAGQWTGAPDRQSAIAAVIHFASRQRDFIHIRELPGYTAMCNEILGLDAKETDPVATATT